MGNERRLVEQGRRQEARFGTANSNTRRLLAIVREEMARARTEAGL